LLCKRANLPQLAALLAYRDGKGMYPLVIDDAASPVDDRRMSIPMRIECVGVPKQQPSSGSYVEDDMTQLAFLD